MQQEKVSGSKTKAKLVTEFERACFRPQRCLPDKSVNCSKCVLLTPRICKSRLSEDINAAFSWSHVNCATGVRNVL